MPTRIISLTGINFNARMKAHGSVSEHSSRSKMRTSSRKVPIYIVLTLTQSPGKSWKSRRLL